MDRQTPGKFLADLRTQIRELRIESGATQAEFAEKGGNQHQSAIARIESGSSPNIGIKTLYEIAQATPLPLWQIIKKAEAYQNKATENDDWSNISNEISLLSKQKKDWVARIVREVMSEESKNLN